VSSPWSNPAWEQIRDRHADLFQETFAFSRRTTRFNLAVGGQTDFVDGVYASGRYFDALRLQPMLGRAFTANDDRRGGGPNGPVAVVSYAFWQRRFGGSPDVVGKTQTIDRVPFTIVGVMPPEFFGTDVGTRSDVILPIGTEPLMRGRDSLLDRASWLLVMARLKDGQTIESAEQALRGVQPQIREATLPANASAEARARHFATPFGVQSAADGTSAMRARYRQPILAIMTVVALVLGFGVLIGTAASIWASKFIVTLLYGLVPRDPATLIASAAVLATVGALAGALPAYRASRVDPAEVLREG
jgi:ABC-type antimicrobial peptide transport system permease subunit